VHRGIFSAVGTEDIAFNETYVVLKHGCGIRKVAMLGWQLTVGSPACPGMARALEIFTKQRNNLLNRWKATVRGRVFAMLTFCRQISS
jgi:hypothetical protein